MFFLDLMKTFTSAQTQRKALTGWYDWRLENLQFRFLIVPALISCKVYSALWQNSSDTNIHFVDVKMIS